MKRETGKRGGGKEGGHKRQREARENTKTHKRVFTTSPPLQVRLTPAALGRMPRGSAEWRNGIFDARKQRVTPTTVQPTIHRTPPSPSGLLRCCCCCCPNPPRLNNRMHGTSINARTRLTPSLS